MGAVFVEAARPALENRVEERLMALGRAGGALRRVGAALAGRLVAGRGCERLGYARLGDYARERLGVSARTLQELARVDAQLRGLPRLEAALISGRLPWSKVRLVARAAERESETALIARAQAVSVRVLERELRAVARGALEAEAVGDEEGGSSEPRGRTVVRMSAQTAFKWQRTRRYAAQVAGERVSDEQVLEWVTAEVLGELPGDLVGRGLAEDDAAGSPVLLPECPLEAADVCAACASEGPEDRVPEVAVGAADVCAAHMGGAEGGDPEAEVAAGSCALPAFLQPLVEDLDALDPFALDARLRRVTRLEQRRDAELGRLLAVVADAEYEWSAGYQRCEVFAQDQLGISPRKARALRRLERVGAVWPALRERYRDGGLSWLQAQALARLVGPGEGEHGGLGAWLAWAPTVSVRRLEETVSRALLLRDADPNGHLPAPEVAAQPEAEAAAERQTCAQPTRPEMEVRLQLQGSADVIALFRSTLCSVRLALERRTGLLPSQGEAFDAMLDVALRSWQVEDRWLARHARRALAIFERDGWRCTVPGCTSQRNLQRHHIRFRSAGGGDEPQNQTTLCAFHHLRGVHAGRLRISGQAPDALWYELGTSPGRPPLARYRSGDRIAYS